MNTFIALCYFALSLYGFDVGGNALMHRKQGDPGIARLQCLGSDGVQCHYILFPRTAPPARDPAGEGLHEHCRLRPLDRFADALDADPRIRGFAALGLRSPAAGTHPKAACETPAARVGH